MNSLQVLYGKYGINIKLYEANVTSGNFYYTVVFMLVLHLKIFFSLKDHYMNFTFKMLLFGLIGSV